MRLFPRSIGHFLLVTMLTLSAPGLGFLAYDAWQAMTSMQLQDRLGDLVDADRALLLAANKIRSNRGAMQTAVQVEDDARSIIIKISDSNKTDIERAVAQLRKANVEGREALVAGIAQSMSRIDAEMTGLMAEAAKPKASRTLAATMPWYNAVGDTEAAMAKASEAASNAIRLADPVLADLQGVKQAAYRARSTYGLQCTVLRPVLAAGQAMTAAQQKALGETRGATATSVASLRSLAARPGFPPALATKVDAMIAGLDAGTRSADELVAKLGSGTGPVITADQWTKQCNAPFAPVMETVEAALDDMSRFSDAQLASARLRLAVIGGLMLGLLGLAFVSGLAIRRRISSPLAGISQALVAMQRGELNRPIPPAPCPDEVGVLSLALEHYRAGALEIEADRTARDRSLATEADRAAKVQALVAEVAAVVAAARRGDFTGQADPGAVTGPVRDVVEGVNEINRLVNSATAEFASVLGALSEGDLTHRVATSYEGRFAELKEALNSTIDRLSETVVTIQGTAAEVSSAAREINAGANDLSSRTEQQASSLEETAATTEQLAASVKAAAHSSRRAVDLTQDAVGIAEMGGSIVRDAIAAMAGIEQASRKITDITGVIDEIAFQTNLLALNAAVEAARAGEAGKGFAVVASEVRSLAQRSSEAAKDITSLIGASEAEVAKGVQLVRQTGDALDRIVVASRKVSETVTEISTATGEQANGIDEMSQAVAHMDDMTQHNAALAEESAASASSLTGQIDRLNDLVGTFRTRAGQGASGHSIGAAASAGYRSPAPLRRRAG